MEAHLVHYNEKYGNVSTAMTQKDGIAVAAFFIQAKVGAHNIDFSLISDRISKIQEPGTKFNIHPSSKIHSLMK